MHAVCPENYFLKNCQGLHAGVCIACDSLPCNDANLERIECGGTSQGRCAQKWLAVTPVPEGLLWGQFLTENPTPNCVDNGGNQLNGVVREFGIRDSLLRLGPCTEATVTGKYTLQAQGDWIVSFYVGVPSFGVLPYDTPAAYPLEKDGQPDPTDFLEVIINGYTQRFLNAIQELGDLNKLVFYQTVNDTKVIDFKFIWKSSNIHTHLHLFAAPGTAAFIGDILPLNKALSRLQLGKGKIKGIIIANIFVNMIFAWF